MTTTGSARLSREDAMATTTDATQTSRRSRWLTAASAVLLLFGAFNVFAAVLDLIATSGMGLPSDHNGTFRMLAGRSWESVKAAQPGTARYVTLLERGYALHELTFAILFIVIAAIPVRAGRRWAWWSCWAMLIAYGGYAATFGAHDAAIWPRSLVGVIGLPLILLACIPAFFRRREG